MSELSKNQEAVIAHLKNLIRMVEQLGIESFSSQDSKSSKYGHYTDPVNAGKEAIESSVLIKFAAKPVE